MANFVDGEDYGAWRWYYAPKSERIRKGINHKLSIGPHISYYVPMLETRVHPKTRQHIAVRLRTKSW